MVHFFHGPAENGGLWYRDGLGAEAFRLLIDARIAIIDVLLLRILGDIVNLLDLFLPLTFFFQSFLSFSTESWLLNCNTLTGLNGEHFLHLLISKVVLGENHGVHFLNHFEVVFNCIFCHLLALLERLYVFSFLQEFSKIAHVLHRHVHFECHLSDSFVEDFIWVIFFEPTWSVDRGVAPLTLRLLSSRCRKFCFEAVQALSVGPGWCHGSN